MTISDKGYGLRVTGYRLLVIVFLLLPFTFHLSPAYAQIGMEELGDSLMAYTGFSTVWAPAVRVKQLRVNGNNVTIRTNGTLRDYRWTPSNVAEIKRRVSRWTLGHEKGKVTVFSAGTDIETLITECAKSQKGSGKCAKSKCDLEDRNIVLYPSHGLYFNRDRQEWIWQRATLWTTVEDLYSQEYVRLIRQMLENAGATVLSPRATLDQTEPGISGMPHWTEGARYHLQTQQADSSLWDLYEGDEYKDDMKCRAMWVNSLETPPDLCLALHTDGLDSGDDTTIVGTLAIYTARDDDKRTRLHDGRDREKTNRNLADWIQTTITEDLRHIAPEWTRRQLREANYCESRVPVVPSMILELLSHKNMADMRYGLDPAFRFTAARAVYKGIVRYLNGPNAIVQPLPVQELGIGTDGVLRWQAPIDSIESLAEPSYYMVYIQKNDDEWDVQQVESTQLKVNLQPGIRYAFYVVAGNDGGLSFPSPIVSAYQNSVISSQHSDRILVVDGFNDVYGPEWFADSTYAGIVPGSYACEDRYSCAYIGEQWNYTRTDPWTNDDNCGWGSCHRDHAGQFTIGNTRDYTVMHGRVLQQMGISYVSCTAGMMKEYRIQNTEYRLIDYICGRNRVPMTVDHCSLLTDYIDQGGHLLLSTDHFSALDSKWTKRYLHTTYYAAQATRSGKVQLRYEDAPKRPFTILLSPNESQLFTDHAEGLKAEQATVWATYLDMRVPAAVATSSTLVFGFPLETVTDFEQLYKNAIKWLYEKEESTRL